MTSRTQASQPGIAQSSNGQYFQSMSQIFAKKANEAKIAHQKQLMKSKIAMNNSEGVGGSANNNNNFDNKRDESYSYKALMEMKGSKCRCLPKFGAGPAMLAKSFKFSNHEESKDDSRLGGHGGTQNGVCGTYCKHLSPRQQRKIVLKLIRNEQNRQMLRG